MPVLLLEASRVKDSVLVQRKRNYFQGGIAGVDAGFPERVPRIGLDTVLDEPAVEPDAQRSWQN